MELNSIDISQDDFKLLSLLLDKYLSDTEIWAFGSRVKGTAQPQSDLDLVAFITDEQVQSLYDLRDALAESNLTFRVDIFSWNDIPDNFKENISRQYVVWDNKAISSKYSCSTKNFTLNRDETNN